MAVTFTGAGTATAASGNSPQAVTTTTALAVGDALVVLIAYDNSGGGGADSMSGTVTATPATGAVSAGVGGQTGLNDPGTASSGVCARCIAFPVTTAIPSGTVVNVSWSGTIVVRAVVLMKVATAGRAVYRTNSGSTGTNGVAVTTVALTTPSVTNGEGVLCWAAHENGAAITGDADTTNGTWSAVYGTFQGSAQTGMAAYFQSKVVTATATQAFNPTGTSSDWIVGALIFSEVTTVTATRATTWNVRVVAVTQAAYQFFDDAGTESGAASLAALNTAITGNLGNGDGFGVLRVRLQNSADALPATDDWQLQYEKNASGTWASAGSGVALLDSYAETNRDSQQLFAAPPSTTAVGQSFTGNGEPLVSASFTMRAMGAPTGNVVAYLYAHSGTFGSTGVPTGAPLATSNVVAASFLAPNVFFLQDFNFVSQYTLVNGTRYFIVVEHTTSTGTNWVEVGTDQSSPTHAGNATLYAGSAWITPSYDLIFQVATLSQTVTGYNNPNLTDGAATTNRLGAGTGTFVAGKISETGVAPDVGITASNYTELVYSLKLLAANFAHGDTLRFRVVRNGATTGLTYTQVPTINIVRIVTTVTATRATTWKVAAPPAGGLAVIGAHTYTTSGGTSCTIATPVHSPGDLLVWFMGNNQGQSSPAYQVPDASAGAWVLAGQATANYGGYSPNGSVYLRTAGASEPSTFQCNSPAGSGGQNHSVAMVAVRGAAAAATAAADIEVLTGEHGLGPLNLPGVTVPTGGVALAFSTSYPGFGNSEPPASGPWATLDNWDPGVSISFTGTGTTPTCVIPYGGGDTAAALIAIAPSAAAANPKLETLTDTFDTEISTTKWPDNYGGVWEDGRVKLPVDWSYYSLNTGINAGQAYDLTDSEIFAQVTLPGHDTRFTEFWLQVRLQGTDQTDRLFWHVTGGQIEAMRVEGDNYSAVGTSLTYSPTNHAFLKIREASGTAYFETSPNGTTWNSFGSINTPTWDITQCYVTLGVGGEPGGPFYIDNVNVVPAPTVFTLTDDFNRANGALGANWASLTGATQPVIVSNAIEASAALTDTAAVVSGTTFAVQSVAMDIVLGANYSEAGAIMHATNTTELLFCVFTTDGTHPDFPGFGTIDGPALQLYYGHSSAYTMLGEWSLPVATGTHRLYGIALEGNWIELWFDGVRMVTGTDDGAVARTGKPGITQHHATTPARVDNAVVWSSTTNPPEPTITNISPSSGLPGDTLTITGTGFIADATMLSYGEGERSPITVTSPTTATFKIPAGAYPGYFTPAFRTPGGVAFAGFMVLDPLGPTFGPTTEISNNSTVSHTSITVAAPPGISGAADQRVYLCAFVVPTNSSNPGITPPAGFVAVGGPHTDSVLSGSGIWTNTQWFVSTTDHSADTSFTVTFASSIISRMTAGVVYNTTGTEAAEAYGSTTGTTLPAPSVTTTTVNSGVLVWATADPTAYVQGPVDFFQPGVNGTDEPDLNTFFMLQPTAGPSSTATIEVFGGSSALIASTLGWKSAAAPSTTPVSASRSTTWNVRAGVTATKATTWNTRFAVAVTRGTTWNTRFTVAPTRGTTWNTRFVVAPTRGTTWVALATVTPTRATTWVVKTATTVSRATTWNALFAVAPTRATTWVVRTVVTATRPTTWAVATAVTATRTTTWNVASPVAPPIPTTGLTIWLDASQLGLADGAAVSPWPNLGSGPSAAILGTPAPVVKTNILNGLPVVRFSAGEGRVRSSGTGAGEAGLNWTVLYVARIRDTAAGRVVGAIYPPSNLLVGYWNGFENVFYVEGFLNPDARRSQTTDWKLFSAAGEGTSGSAMAWAYENGVFQSGNHLVTGGWQDTFSISGYDSTTAETPNCDVAEVIFYDHRLSDVERIQVENYLRNKWLPVAATTPVSASRGTTWNVGTSVTATRATTWNTRSAVTTVTRATTWRTLAPITMSAATTWRTLVPVAGTNSRSTAWITRAAIPVMRAATWNTLVPVATPATRSTTWTVRTPVTATRATTWAVIQGVVATRATSWNVAGALTTVSASRSTTWAVAATVGASRGSTWAVLARVTPTTRATTWNALATAASSTRSTTWAVLTTVAPTTRSTTWAALASVTGTRQTTWQALAAVAPVTRPTLWNAQGQVTTSRQASWNTAGALAFVSTSRSTTWITRATITPTRPTTWTTMARVAPTTRATTWAVLTAVAPVSRSTTWFVRVQVTLSRQTTWNVAGSLFFISASRSTAWVVGTTTSTSRATTWRALAQVPVMRAVTWSVNTTALGLRSTTWRTRESVVTARVTTWRVASRTIALRSTTWHVRPAAEIRHYLTLYPNTVLYHGEHQVHAIYQGSTKVWP